MRKSNRTTVNEFALKLYEEILPIWQKANIPTVNKKNCVKRLTILLSSWIKQDCCKMGPGSVNEIKCEGMLDSLFNMTYSDLERVKEELKKQKLLHKVQTFECQEMKTWEIDFEFLLNQMMHPQIGSMDSLDTDLTKRKKL